MGSTTKSSNAKRSPRRARRRKARPSDRQKSTLEIMQRLLMRPVSISIDGQPEQVSATEAIVLQPTQKALSGAARAWRALLKYQEFASSRAARSTQLRFAESDYTRVFANLSLGDDDA